MDAKTARKLLGQTKKSPDVGFDFAIASIEDATRLGSTSTTFHKLSWWAKIQLKQLGYKIETHFENTKHQFDSVDWK